MAYVTPIQPNFNGGELSPILEGRVDLKAYAKGLRLCRNWIPLAQGCLVRRPGTRYLTGVKASADQTVLCRFVFSRTQAYILEFGDQYIRFYTNRGQIQSGASPYEVVSPYPKSVVDELYFYQSADVLFIAHPNYALRTLSRTSDTSWTLAEYAFDEPPYAPSNATATTLTASATTGAVTLTASASIFASTDVGRAVRLKHPTSAGWGWGTITAYTSGTVVTLTVAETLPSTAATKFWALGLFSNTTGHPSCGTFFGNRHYLAGCRAYPSTIAGSVVGAYNNFAPSALSDGVIADDNSILFTLGSDQVEKISWVSPANNGLGVGTVEAEWTLRASIFGEALTPSNVQAVQISAVGSAAQKPLKIIDEVLFVQAARRQLWAFGYDFGSDAFDTNDRTLFADHMTANGIRSLAFQQTPHSIVWVADDDGNLLGFSYLRKQEVFAWHRHDVGGKVKWVETIPNPSNTADDLWLIVEREIDGNTVQYIEYLSDFFTYGTAQEDSVFLDSSLTYDSTPETTFSGLDHLEGETVAIIADGGEATEQVVTGGEVTIQDAASVVTVGLRIDSTAFLQRVELGDLRTQTSQSDVKKIGTMYVRLWRSLGVTVGETLSEMSNVIYRNAADIIDIAVPLYTGDAEAVFPGGYSQGGDIYVRNATVYPTTLLSVVAEMTMSDSP